MGGSGSASSPLPLPAGSDTHRDHLQKVVNFIWVFSPFWIYSWSSPFSDLFHFCSLIFSVHSISVGGRTGAYGRSVGGWSSGCCRWERDSAEAMGVPVFGLLLEALVGVWVREGRLVDGKGKSPLIFS